MIKSYRELIVWQKALRLSLIIYRLTSSFPKEEIFGLVSQMRRAAVSVPSNIAEGRSRTSRKDFVQFLRIALGSASELQTQVEIAHQLTFVGVKEYNECNNLISEIIMMINSMIRKLLAPSSKL